MTQLSPTPIKNALQSAAPFDAIRVQGWVRTRRDSKDFSFIELNDGSSLRNLQIIAKKDALPNYADIQRLNTGASIVVEGALVPSQGKGQSWELVARDIEIVGGADESYPLQKKGHTPEFLREIAHLRPRSNLFGCVFRVRSRLAFAVHQFFQDRGFVYVHTPIITGSDCEGAGELFRVSTLDVKNPPQKNGEIDYAQDFFARQTYLTVSGQLEAEAFACALQQGLYLRPHVSRREFKHVPACQRILDDRAGNGILRSDRQHGSRRRVGEVFDHRREKAVLRRIGIVREIRGQGVACPIRFRD